MVCRLFDTKPLSAPYNTDLYSVNNDDKIDMKKLSVLRPVQVFSRALFIMCHAWRYYGREYLFYISLWSIRPNIQVSGLGYKVKLYQIYINATPIYNC